MHSSLLHFELQCCVEFRVKSAPHYLHCELQQSAKPLAQDAEFKNVEKKQSDFTTRTADDITLTTTS